MPFNSITFVFYFLPAFLLLYVLVRNTYARNVLLLAASLCFYAWGEFRYLSLLLASAAVNYALGLRLSSRSGGARRAWMWAGVTLNLAPLVVLKYATLKLALPIGISFFTFKAISYLVDVHRKDVVPERDPLIFATYLTMFPQILAGPIERFTDAQKAIRERRVTLSKFRLGAERFMIGMAEKLLIANTLAGPANTAFSTMPAALSAHLAWLGIVCYTLEIYFDFAGYTDMAIGIGHMMGFSFPRNFNYPYTASSITDFWQRWHITLSGWLRDYVWYPLGANRKGKLRTYSNLLIVFALCGLWHGANYTFLLWGLFHGLLLVIERAGLLGVLKKMGRSLAAVYSVLMVMIGWVLFRADSLPQAVQYLGAMAGQSAAVFDDRVSRLLSVDVVLALIAGVLFSFPWSALRPRLSERAQTAWSGASAAALTAVFLLALMELAQGSYNPFLYFRF